MASFIVRTALRWWDPIVLDVGTYMVGYIERMVPQRSHLMALGTGTMVCLIGRMVPLVYALMVLSIGTCMDVTIGWTVLL